MAITVEQHFDNIAPTYDDLKKKNWYYYANLKRTYASIIPPGASVLDIGCGTGDILSHLKPSVGVGIDVSSKMIDIARKKHAAHKELTFYPHDILNYKENRTFNYLLMADVIEHLDDVGKSMERIATLMNQDSKLLVTMANPIWEPALMLAEKFGMKMEEGPHNRISVADLVDHGAHAGLCVSDQRWFLNIPKNIPYVSDRVNAICENLPLVNRLGFVTLNIFSKCG